MNNPQTKPGSGLAKGIKNPRGLTVAGMTHNVIYFDNSKSQ